jgi:hypothetical protein
MFGSFEKPGCEEGVSKIVIQSSGFFCNKKSKPNFKKSSGINIGLYLSKLYPPDEK